MREWASKFTIKRGIFNGTLQLLHVAANIMTPIEKLVVLQYDEMKVAESYEYDKTNDQVDTYIIHILFSIFVIKLLF